VKQLNNYLWLSQISLVLFLVICTSIIPSVAAKNGGVSNFGNHSSTIILYILGFSLCIIFLYLASRVVLKLDSNLQWQSICLVVLAFLYFLVLISTFPRHISFTYSDIHDYLGIVLFIYQFFLSIWLLRKNHNLTLVLFFCIESGGSIVGLMSILKVVDLLYVGQMIGGLGFGLVFVIAFPEYIETSLNSRTNLS